MYKKNILFFLLFLFHNNIISQDVFEPGFYIDNSNDTFNVLIENKDWHNNPNGINIKKTVTEKAEFISTEQFVEFQIFNKTQFIKSKLLTDLNKIDLSNLGISRNPTLKENEILLKVLIKGKASLYSFTKGNLQVFFIQVDSTKIEQLIFKPYQKVHGTIIYNNNFRQQLLNKLTCSNINKSDFKELKYIKSELHSIVKKYNKCLNSNIVDFVDKSNKSNYKFNFALGLRRSNLSFSNVVSSLQDSNFDPKIENTYGIQFEWILPFNNGNWSIHLEPTYHNYKSTHVNENQFIENDTIQIKYNSIEIPLGLKYNFLNKNEFKWYITGVLIPSDIHIASDINFSRGNSLDPSSSLNFGFGTGISLKNKLQIEIIAQTSRDILAKYTGWNSNYKNISFRLRYSIITLN